MKTDIISIGDELLIGQTLNTNAHWIAKELNNIGFEIRQQLSIRDTKEAILISVDEALKHSDVVLITGGLGPTNDDLTMPVLNEYFKGKLVKDDQVYKDIEALVTSRGFDMNQNNQNQAIVPNNCKVIRNENGTAPGLLFEKDKQVVIAMPGVPYEMKAMVSNTIIPFLQEKYELPEIVHQMVYTQGLPESKLAEVLMAWESNLPETIKLAYLPSAGRVKLRLSSIGNDRELLLQNIDLEVNKLNEIIPKYIYSVDNENIESIIGELLLGKKATLATAESCTGGYIAHLITSIPGSSNYFNGAVISYANKIKEEELGVNPEDLMRYGAVSKQVVEQMALSVRDKMNTDYSIATSGIAGPTGGTDEKPVGTIWIAIATPKGVRTKKYLFGKQRVVNIERATITALGMLRKELV
jgi:nicotinamide-nucleotide amidase